MEASYEFDQLKFTLGKICPKGHEYASTGLCLRYLKGSCVECQKNNSRRQSHSGYTRGYMREYYRKNGRRDREKLRALGLTTRGTVPIRTIHDALMRAIRAAGRCPSVARLVMDEQRRYWREHPEAKREHDKQWDRASWWLQYQINPDLRLYVRQKSKRRKALLRQQTAHQIKPRVIRARFAQFDNCCAYCGAAGDMQIEHVVPISKGGTHAIGNIVPSCQACNYSKREHEVERWYRAQPQFSEKRWRKICRVLGWDRGSVGQLALL